MSTLLVTGANGFIGRYVSQVALAQSYKLRCAVRNRDAFLERLGAELIVGNLDDPAFSQRAVSGCSVIIHCAGNAKFGDGVHYWEINTRMTQVVVDAAKSVAPNAKLIFLSSIGAVDRSKYDDCSIPLDEMREPSPSSDYGKSKLEAEKLVKLSGLRYTIVRPSMVVGAGMRSGLTVVAHWA